MRSNREINDIFYFLKKVTSDQYLLVYCQGLPLGFNWCVWGGMRLFIPPPPRETPIIAVLKCFWKYWNCFLEVWLLFLLRKLLHAVTCFIELSSYCVTELWWIFIIKHNSFACNKVVYNIKNSTVEIAYLFIYTSI